LAAGSAPRVVIVTRPTEYSRLLQQHGTLGQARFFLDRRGGSLDDLERIHQQQARALATVERGLPSDWRRSRVSRDELDRFLFEPEDLVAVVGQDGLVANVAKYLRGQPVVGVNPSPARYPGVLVPHPPEGAGQLLVAASQGAAELESRVMVQADLDDGQQLMALNEIFVGHASHQSARYVIRWEDREERQSSSGLIVSSGTGATGWARSIHQERGSPLALPAPCEPALVFFVREAWPSVATGTSLVEGRLDANGQLVITSEMERGGVAFGDGIEADHIELLWGQQLRIALASQRLNLVQDVGLPAA
jgi:hypothetical protein